jgi:hypothetical protein
MPAVPYEELPAYKIPSLRNTSASFPVSFAEKVALLS